ncbi:hypothetical protein ACWEQN_13940 [Streptomyces sp. NPDC004129]|uniref:hypothetical protein n=1 Tax=Streptomyces sp. NPDC004533 TaxID=3154278 RepID=UPI00339EBF24
MSTTRHPPRTARRYAWLRVLLVLIALLAAGAHAEAVTADSDTVSASQACDVEHEVLVAALRPANPQGPRAPVPLRPAARGTGGPSAPLDAALVPARAPFFPALRALRTVVLRC